MPLITSSFSPGRLLRSPHIQTILPAIFRRPTLSVPATQSLETPDGDLLLYRLHQLGHTRLAIISHGLEGSMDSSYVLGMTRTLLSSGWDVLTWNMRGCGDMPNRLMTWYHSGKSDDLKLMVQRACALPYESISLIGFSIGGNITLKYLGEDSGNLPPTIHSAVVISVPMDLEGAAHELAKPRNNIYMQYLLRPLRRRIREKAERFPGHFDIRGLSRVATFQEFDSRFTAPFHGFSSVEEYWSTCSSLYFLKTINVPTLAMTATDDPFLSPSCIPAAVANAHEHLYVEVCEYGGHVGFINSLNFSSVWSEERTIRFLEEQDKIVPAPNGTKN